MFFAVNMLNNWAFAFNISVPVHIILRSFGSVTTMGAGFLRGKRYSLIQCLSVALLTVGVLISAWADASTKVIMDQRPLPKFKQLIIYSQGKSMNTSSINFTDASFEAGLVILLAAQLLSAFMGIYVQDVYAEHGNHWDENLFYSHFLSIPMFLPLASTLQSQFSRLRASPPLVLPPHLSSVLPFGLQKVFSATPRSVFMLTLNSITQLICITGVNLLSAKSSAVTVTIVLNIRKLVSFIFSIWLFGNKMSEQMMFGAALVFGAGALYGWETSVGIKKRNAQRKKDINARK